MKTSKKRIVLIILVGLIFLIPIAIFLTERKLEREIKTALEKVHYDDLDVNLLRSRMSLEDIHFSQAGLELKAESLEVRGLNLLALLTKDEIIIKNIYLLGADVTLVSDRKDTTESSIEFDQFITVEQFLVEEGVLKIEDEEEQILKFGIPLLSMQNLEVDSQSLNMPIPFRYESYQITGESLLTHLDSRHTLSLDELQIDKGNVVVRNLQVIPRYSKTEFQNHIPHELDRYDLQVNEIRMESFLLNPRNDSLVIHNSFVEIDMPILEVYRDKLQPDDPSTKLLYSAQLRNLPIILDIEQMHVNNGSIVYLEKVHEERAPIKVEFNDLSAKVWNLKNHPLQDDVLPDTEVKVKTAFMGDAPLAVDWSFNVADLNESFRISGSFEGLPAGRLNNILEPAMNVRAQGSISYLAFNFEGNDHQALGEMQLRYNDFSVDVLRSDGSERSGLLSAIANIFVSNNPSKDEITQSGLKVERVRDKSFWNFLWLCIREGALGSFL